MTASHKGAEAGPRASETGFGPAAAGTPSSKPTLTIEKPTSLLDLTTRTPESPFSSRASGYET